MRPRELIAHYEKLLESAPNDVALLQRLGEACQRAGDSVKAARAFDAIAKSYARDGYFLKAIALSKQVLKLDPTLAHVTRRLAELHSRLGLNKEAQAYEAQLVATPTEVLIADCIQLLEAAQVEDARAALELIASRVTPGLAAKLRLLELTSPATLQLLRQLQTNWAAERSNAALPN